MSQNITKEITIAGQYYTLTIEPSQNAGDGDNCFIFTLRNQDPLGMIPGGFKLKLLTPEGKEFTGNEAKAKQAVTKLEIKVWLNPGEGVIWQTLPTADNYQPELWFRPS